MLSHRAEPPETCLSSPFRDVDPAKWYHESVDYVRSQGLMNGVAPDRFAPNGTMTRAMALPSSTAYGCLRGSILPCSTPRNCSETKQQDLRFLWGAGVLFSQCLRDSLPRPANSSAQGYGGNALRRGRTDKVGVVKMAKYGLDNRAELRDDTPWIRHANPKEWPVRQRSKEARPCTIFGTPGTAA